MNTAQQLRTTLSALDRKGYPAYKSLTGLYNTFSQTFCPGIP